MADQVKEATLDLDWVQKVDVDDVFQILVEHAGMSPFLSLKFASFWIKQEEYEWDFLGALGPHGKMWRGRIRVPGEDGKLPFLCVSCYGELQNEERKAVIKNVNEKFLKILISAGLRKQLKE